MGSIEQTTQAKESIPTVDISVFLSPSATEKGRQDVVDAMSSACSTYGFFNLVGHGVPQALLNKALEVNKRFFSLSHEDRMEVWIEKSLGRSFRGYEPSGMQTHHEGLMPDIKEVRSLQHLLSKHLLG